MQIGPYSVLDEIARGGHGVVYRAQDAQGQVVALKLLLAHRAQNPQARQRFQAEVNALARLRHPHVVPILAAGEHEGCPWLALEYVEGESLAARLRRGPLPIYEAIRVAQQLAQALGYVHSCGVLHRDLKPDNVLLRGNHALLTDFGLALDDQRAASRMTATGVFQGTPGYWAPEQARGETHEQGPATDAYGLGAVLYACLTGQAPVQADSLQEHLQTIRFCSTSSPRTLRPEVPAWLSELCMRCLALAPASRPASAEELARELVLAGGAASVANGRARRRGGWVALGALALVAALGLAWSARPEASAPPPNPSEPSQTDEARRWVKEARRKHKQGRFAEAIKDYDKALLLDPDTATSWANRGAIKASLGRDAEAIEDYDHALLLDPDDARVYANRGLARSNLGREAEAIEDYDKALLLDPNHAYVYANRGLSKFSLGRYAEAIEDCDKALQLDPTHAAAYARRGASKAGLGRHAEAIEDYDRVLQLDVDDAKIYSHRGVSKASLGRYREAIEDYDRALERGLDAVEAAQARDLRAEASAKLKQD